MSSLSIHGSMAEMTVKFQSFKKQHDNGPSQPRRSWITLRHDERLNAKWGSLGNSEYNL